MTSQARYKEFEMLMAAGLIAGAVIFLLYLLVAGFGIVWLKWVLAVLDMGICLISLGILWRSNELLHRRSLWLSCGFFAVASCLLVSLILNYPG